MFCKNCHSSKLTKAGFDNDRQRWECGVCGHKSVFVIEKTKTDLDSKKIKGKRDHDC